MRIKWRASLVPAAAVIPAPLAYIKVVAVKKLVVGHLPWRTWPGIHLVVLRAGVKWSGIVLAPVNMLYAANLYL